MEVNSSDASTETRCASVSVSSASPSARKIENTTWCRRIISTNTPFTCSRDREQGTEVLGGGGGGKVWRRADGRLAHLQVGGIATEALGRRRGRGEEGKGGLLCMHQVRTASAPARTAATARPAGPAQWHRPPPAPVGSCWPRPPPLATEPTSRRSTRTTRAARVGARGTRRHRASQRRPPGQPHTATRSSMPARGSVKTSSRGAAPPG
jgi:hypothetical protein